jgi:SAM domain (Sterile alpha motif)
MNGASSSSFSAAAAAAWPLAARAAATRGPTGNAMKGIAEWLSSIGLSEYAQRFADNAIDLSVLRDLTSSRPKSKGRRCWQPSKPSSLVSRSTQSSSEQTRPFVSRCARMRDRRAKPGTMADSP